jgi:hypothetical protein
VVGDGSFSVVVIHRAGGTAYSGVDGNYSLSRLHYNNGILVIERTSSVLVNSSLMSWYRCIVLQQGRQQQFLWRDGAHIIQAVRTDIYTFSTGRIVGLPEAKLTKTVLQLCRDIIAGVKPILPEGFQPSNLEERAIHDASNGAGDRNRYENDPYLRQMKVRGVSSLQL